MKDFTRGVCFSIMMATIMYAVYNCGKMNGRTEERRRLKEIEGMPVIVVDTSEEKEEES